MTNAPAFRFTVNARTADTYTARIRETDQPIGLVRKGAGHWTAHPTAETMLDGRYRTRVEAAQALLVTADRLAKLEAIADAVEQDVPPTGEDRVTVRIRAVELRPGDLVVDSLGEVQYAAFDVDTADHGGGLLPHLVTVWTAVRDQERGLPPRITVPAARELLVERPVSAEGRELIARAGW
jgi:hypothetical protein